MNKPNPSTNAACGRSPENILRDLLLSCDKNNSRRAGQPASAKLLFGEFSRFAVFAVHTRFDAVEWFVTDAETVDPVTNMHAIVAQDNDPSKAIATALRRSKINPFLTSNLAGRR